jgi:tetratricopeptide (TPR) repeat protein
MLTYFLHFEISIMVTSQANSDTTLYNKGLALYKSENYTGTIKYYDKALAINPKDVNALTDKGLALD